MATRTRLANVLSLLESALKKTGEGEFWWCGLASRAGLRAAITCGHASTFRFFEERSLLHAE